MKITLLAILSIFALNVYSQNFNYNRDYDSLLLRSKTPADTLYYNKLLSQFNVNDSSLTDFEVLALMIGYTGQPNFEPYSYLETERKIFKLNDERDFKTALAICDTFLKSHPLSQTALIEKSYSFYKLGEVDSADYYLYKFRRIMKAMNWTRDVKDDKIIVFSIGPTDGQNFINKFLSGKIGTMGSGNFEGNFCDILECIVDDETDKFSMKFYFTIPHATKTMFKDLDFDKLLEEKPKEKKKPKK